MTGRSFALASLLVAVALPAAGCGGDDPEQVLSETAQNLREIRSGELSMRMQISAGRGGEVGFALAGPFALPRNGGMLKTRMKYTRIVGRRRATVTITSTGRRAFVTANGRTKALPAAQARRLRVGRGGAAGQLRIGSWVRDPEVVDGPTLDGVETQRVSAKLNVRTVARDLLSVAGALGPEGRSALGGSAGQLERGVVTSSFVFLTGKEDRLLRHLGMGIDLSLPRDRLAQVRFVFAVEKPNQPVRIAAPSR